MVAPMKGLTIAVTGATGFVGSAVARLVVGRGATVRSLVRTGDGAPGEVVLGDLERAGWPPEAFEGVDVVVHCAAALGGPPQLQTKVNVEGSSVVARRAAAAGVARFVHVSSIAVYGYTGTEFPETRPPTPSRQIYSLTKAAAEAEVRAAFPGAAIVRPGGIFGPGARFWSARFAKRAGRRLAFHVGDGSGTLPVVYVDDVADLIATVTVHPAAPGEAFNCVIDPQPTWRDYHRAYAALADGGRWIGLPVTPVRLGAGLLSRLAPPGSNGSVAGELVGFTLSPKHYPMDKARRLLGWSPRYDVAAGVAATAPWLRSIGVI
jgi:nucleoside-diphosphate-sugar epimerase